MDRDPYNTDTMPFAGEISGRDNQRMSHVDIESYDMYERYEIYGHPWLAQKNRSEKRDVTQTRKRENGKTGKRENGKSEEKHRTKNRRKSTGRKTKKRKNGKTDASRRKPSGDHDRAVRRGSSRA